MAGRFSERPALRYALKFQVIVVDEANTLAGIWLASAIHTATGG
jgi:hypothetical protein